MSGHPGKNPSWALRPVHFPLVQSMNERSGSLGESQSGQMYTKKFCDLTMNGHQTVSFARKGEVRYFHDVCLIMERVVF